MYAPELSNIRRILCLGCHSDDIEIGCGGTVLRLLKQCPHLQVQWVVLSGEGIRADEAHTSAQRFLQAATAPQIEVQSFTDRYFFTQAEQLKNYIHSVSQETSPDLIFTHRLEDRHQDHRLVAELTWNAFRDHWILEYEIPKYEGDLGQPNVYVPFSVEQATSKAQTIYESFVSQQSKPWFTVQTFTSLMRLRGLECNAPSGYAEGFYCRKTTL